MIKLFSSIFFSLNKIFLFLFIKTGLCNISFTDSTSAKPKKKVGKKRVKRTLKKKTSKKKKSLYTHGTVVNVSDEIVYCIGLSGIKFGEIVFLMLEKSRCEGLVVNISWNITSCIFFSDVSLIKPGLKVINTGTAMCVKISTAALGGMVDCLGYSIITDGDQTDEKPSYYRVERPAPGITLRQSIFQPLHTGNILVDSLFPIGRGQRELILGDRQTGKTTVAVNAIRTQKYDTLLNSYKKKLYCIYVAVGQKKSNIIKLFYFLKKEKCLDYTIVIAVSASDPASLQFLAPYAGCAFAEFFRDRGQDTLVIYDDLSKQAVAYRQISLLLRRPPGREAYPGDIFYLHARLLERAAKMSSQFKGGSLTALPIVETLVGDITSYIPTNVISITDGQIFLDNQIFNEYYKPAVNIKLSVSRVGSKAQLKLYRSISKKFLWGLTYYLNKAQTINLSDDSDLSADMGKRYFMVVNHRNFLCIELQLFFMILIVSGFLFQYNLKDTQLLINKLSLKYNNNFNLKMNLHQDILIDSILEDFRF